MATISKNVAASYDDGQVYQGGSSFEPAGSSFGWGKDDRGSGLNVFESWVRFLDIQIEFKSKINSAYLTFYNCSSGPFGHASATIYACAADSSAQMSSYSDYYARGLTSASLGITGVNGTLTSGDIKALVQEVVDRPAWVFGNNMQFEMRNAYGGGQEVKTFCGSYDGGYYANLSVDFTPPAMGILIFFERWRKRLYNNLIQQGAVPLGRRELLPI